MLSGNNTAPGVSRVVRAERWLGLRRSMRQTRAGSRHQPASQGTYMAVQLWLPVTLGREAAGWPATTPQIDLWPHPPPRAPPPPRRGAAVW